MEYGIISCVPILVLIIGALATKRIAEMMIISAVLGAVLVHKQNFFSGIIEMMYGVLSNQSYQFVLMILLGFGGMIKLFQMSGALSGFSNIMYKYAHGPRRPLIIAWLMSFIMFVDDYLNTLAVSFSMRDTTDKNGIPREHLAYQSNSMAACLCVLIPFTSWTAFTVGLIEEQGLHFMDYVKAIPFMFYPIVAVIVCLFVAVGIIPKVGALKKSYQRVKDGGPILLDDKNKTSIVDMEMKEDSESTSPLNFLIPIAVMITFVLLFDNSLVHGLIAAIIVQLILYLPQRIMNLNQFMDYFFDGLKSMATLAFIIFFAFILNSANETLGFAEFLINSVGNDIPPSLFPVIVFVLVAFTTFATSGYWVIQVITIPIFIPLAASLGLDYYIVISAIMSGVAFGSNFCFYSDSVFMTSAGTGVSNIRQIKVATPYVLSSATLAAIGYIILGLIVA